MKGFVVETSLPRVLTFFLLQNRFVTINTLIFIIIFFHHDPRF